MVSARAYAAATVANDKIYVIGGFDGKTGLTVNEAYIPAREGSEDPWEDGAPLPESRYAMGSAVLADIIYVAGGVTASPGAAAILEYLPQQNTWRTSQDPPQTLGSSLVLETVNTHLYALGGRLDGSPQALNQAYQAIYTILLPITTK
jgi:N-acetylneuraminic acid mutarotase